MGFGRSKVGTGWGAWSCGQVSSDLTAASADRLFRRKERRFEAVMAIGDPSTDAAELRVQGGCRVWSMLERLNGRQISGII